MKAFVLLGVDVIAKNAPPFSMPFFSHQEAEP